MREMQDLTAKNSTTEVFWSRHILSGYRPEVRVFATLTQVGINYYLFGGEGTKMMNSVHILHHESLKWERYSVKDIPNEPSPEGRTGHTANAWRNFLVVYGGVRYVQVGYDSESNLLSTCTCS